VARKNNREEHKEFVPTSGLRRSIKPSNIPSRSTPNGIKNIKKGR